LVAVGKDKVKELNGKIKELNEKLKEGEITVDDATVNDLLQQFLDELDLAGNVDSSKSLTTAEAQSRAERALEEADEFLKAVVEEEEAITRMIEEKERSLEEDILHAQQELKWHILKEQEESERIAYHSESEDGLLDEHNMLKPGCVSWSWNDVKENS
jgi:hypothetical protein